MPEYEYTHSNGDHNLTKIEQEIRDEAFGDALVRSYSKDADINNIFDRELTAGEQATLNALILNHVNAPEKHGYACLMLKDGVSAPAAEVGCTKLFVCETTGDLKVKFGDGHTVTLAVDE